MKNRSGIKIAILISFAFFIFGLLILKDIGTTWDEPESYTAGKENIQVIGNFVKGMPIQWPVHILCGYQFLFDTVRGIAGQGINCLIGDQGSIYGFHLFNLLISVSILFITFLIGRDVSAQPVIGWLAAGVLALHPKFIAHSQANPKDMIGVFVLMLSVWIMIRAAQSNTWRTSIYLAIIMGFALASHVASVILYPLAGVWLLITNQGEKKIFLLRIMVIFSVSLFIAFLCWPWLWAHPYNSILNIMDIIRTFREPFDVLYLGKIYNSYSMPWHYSLVSVMAATPLLFIITTVAGIVRFKEKNKNIRQLIMLSLLLLSFVFIAEAMGSAHYDGVRHVLASLPALALLSGCGLSWIGHSIWRLLSNRRYAPATACAIMIVTAFVSIPVQLVTIHPYYDAYLNEGVRFVVGSHAENAFELEYWCFTYKEASEWLNDNAPHGAVVLVPMAPHVMKSLLRKDLQPAAGIGIPPAYRGPCFMVIMTRCASYNDTIINIREALQPVFTIQRENSVLLEIYRFAMFNH